MSELLWSFMPWLVFLVATRVLTFGEALVVGAVAAVVVFGRAITRRHVRLLDVTSLVYFLALAAVVIVARPAGLDGWAPYAQAGSHAVLTVVVFGSVLVGRPFTGSYARQTTPRQFWSTPEFGAVNRRISTAWGLAFLVGTVSLVIAGSVDYREVLLRVVVPFGALVWAYKYTQAQIAENGAPSAVEAAA